MPGLDALDLDSVQMFWDGRAEKDVSTLNKAMFQEKHGDLALRRHKRECGQIHKVLAPYLRIPSDWVALDAGCGTGRLTFWFSQFCERVVGFDISPGLIEICNAQKDGIPNVDFTVASLHDFSLGCFDLIVVSGVCLYTTDDLWPGIMRSLKAASKEGTIFVIRETVGRSGRYELHNVWSQEIETRYSAIYRDPDWFRALFGQFCETVYDAPLLPPHLEKWKETEQRLMVFRRQRGRRTS